MGRERLRSFHSGSVGCVVAVASLEGKVGG